MLSLPRVCRTENDQKEGRALFYAVLRYFTARFVVFKGENRISSEKH